MPILLGLAAAASFGAADYLGGVATRRGNVSRVVFGSQTVSLVLATVLFGAIGMDGELTGRVLLLSAGAGVLGLAGLILLFRGLAIGRMGLVGPLSALVVTAVPVGWGIGTGDHVTLASVAGTILAVLSVVMVTRERSTRGRAGSLLAPVLHAVGAGVAFGVVFILFGETGEESGYWPLIVCRVVTVTLLGSWLLVTRQRLVPSLGTRPTVVAAGVCDILGNACFLIGVRQEALAIIAPVTSLYPAGTVLLARVFLDEAMDRHQVLGFMLTLPALVLLSVG